MTTTQRPLETGWLDGTPVGVGAAHGVWDLCLAGFEKLGFLPVSRMTLWVR